MINLDGAVPECGSGSSHGEMLPTDMAASLPAQPIADLSLDALVRRQTGSHAGQRLGFVPTQVR